MQFNYKKYPVTAVTVGICILVYLYTTVKYGLEMNAYQGIAVGGMNPILVLKYGEFYRLVTANFIHFGLMHIFCNCYSLINLGSVMEELLGFKRYLIIIIVATLATTIFPCFFYLFFGSGATSIMGGISGTIFGLMGSLLALAWKFKDVYAYIFKQIAPSVLFMLVISVLVPSISLSGHISGMFGGFIATLAIIHWMPLNIWKRRQPTDYRNLVN